MDKQIFMVVIDTTEERGQITLPKGIINTYLIKAVDENHAKQIILRTMIPQVARQLVNSLYVYPVQPLIDRINLADESSKTLPMFSFMPLNGARPPKVLMFQDDPAPKNQEEQPPVENKNPIAKNQTVVTKRTVVPPTIQPKNIRQVRSAGFQQPDYIEPPTTSNSLTPEQADIIKSLGVNPLQPGENEGANPRINSSVGKNLNLTRQVPTPSPINDLTPEQAAILKSVGALDTVAATITENVAYNSDEVLIEPDASLMEVPTESSFDITALQQEYQQIVSETGFAAPDSTPGQIPPSPQPTTTKKSRGKK